MPAATFAGLLAIDWVALLSAAWLLIGLAGLVVPRNFRLVAHVLYPAGAAVAAAMALAAVLALSEPAQVMTLVLGLPGLPMHWRLDGLSAFFLAILGAVAAGISTFAAGYIRAGEGTAPGLQGMQYHLFLAAMAWVLLADDAYAFMVAWETMALASFFLVNSDHRLPEIRGASFLYLVVAHIGAIAILFSFGVLAGDLGAYSFAAMRAAGHDPAWASTAFLFALFGFAAKAGALPLHVWLPEAHPAAPSPVSAMMSAVMLKTAIYGLLRVSLDLLHVQQWWWGIVALAIGLATALYGVVFSAVQSDMKRLLAYSSIENIGLILAGVGLTITFRAFSMAPLAALALTATLFHCLNHAAFKSLLFLATGSVLHATGSRNLGRLGGLIHRMPWVAWLALVGVLASAGLPPFNGFVSEWLLLQSFLFTPGLPHAYVNMLLPLGAAVVALTAALAGYVMVKFFGVIFLGQPREAALAQAHDCGRLERAALAWLAGLCVALGLLPVPVVEALEPVTQALVGAKLAVGEQSAGGWLLAPINADRASYVPVAFFVAILAAFAISTLAVRRLFRAPTRRALPWDCGMPLQTPRMQDTAEGFGQPIRQVFEPFFRMQRQIPSSFDRKPRYRVTVDDHFWHWLYLPIVRLADAGSQIVSILQRGRIAVYLLYSFATLVVLLFLVR